MDDPKVLPFESELEQYIKARRFGDEMLAFILSSSDHDKVNRLTDIYERFYYAYPTTE